MSEYEGTYDGVTWEPAGLGDAHRFKTFRKREATIEPVVQGCAYWTDGQHCYETEAISGSYDGGHWNARKPEWGKKCACGAVVKPAAK